MFIVITGLDGSGTSTVAENLHKMDEGSLLVRTPSIEYANREYIDNEVRQTSQIAHYLYYLSSVVYISEKIKRAFDYKNKNVYCVRYLIDTVVSHNSAGLNVELEYEKYGILKPDLTIFIKLNEETRNVMYLRILGNLEYEEIGEIMGKTSNWARVTFFRGKQKMKGDGENEKGM